MFIIGWIYHLSSSEGGADVFLDSLGNQSKRSPVLVKRKKLNLKNTTEHPRNPPAEFKLQALRRCFENGESVKSVSEEIEYSRASIYMWRKRYLQGGAASLMNTKNIKPGKLPDMDKKISSEEVESLRKQMYEL